MVLRAERVTPWAVPAQHCKTIESRGVVGCSIVPFLAKAGGLGHALYLLNGQVCQFGTMKAASHQNCQHRAVPPLTQPIARGAVHQLRALLQAQPVARAMSELSSTFHTLNPGSQISTQQSAVRRFMREPPDGT